jgi:hypothetical protein
MLRILSFLLVFLPGLNAQRHQLPIDEITARIDLAEWVGKCDLQSWLSQNALAVHLKKLDALEARIPETYFHFQNEEGSWESVFGYWSSAGFSQLYRFVSGDSGIVFSAYEFDRNQWHPMFLATTLSDSVVAKEPSFEGINLQRYVRMRNRVQSEIVYLPARNEEGGIPFGRSARFLINVRTMEIDSMELRAVAVQHIYPEKRGGLKLSSEASDLPSFEAFCLAWRLRHGFAFVQLETNWIATRLAPVENGGWEWMHARKRQEGEPTPGSGKGRKKRRNR